MEEFLILIKTERKVVSERKRKKMSAAVRESRMVVLSCLAELCIGPRERDVSWVEQKDGQEVTPRIISKSAALSKKCIQRRCSWGKHWGRKTEEREMWVNLKWKHLESPESSFRFWGLTPTDQNPGEGLTPVFTPKYTPRLWAFDVAWVWTLPFTTTGSICLPLRLASGVDWAKIGTFLVQSAEGRNVYLKDFFSSF